MPCAAAQPQLAALHGDRVVLSGGYWDGSLRAHSPEDGRLLQCLSYHRDQVTCLAVSGGALAAGCQMGVCVGGIGGGIGGGGGGLEAPRLYFPLLACARLAHLLPLAGRPG
jgi:hypothetical protein